MNEHGPEVVDAELVDDDRLPTTPTHQNVITGSTRTRPLLTQHTVLRPGELPTASQPAYTARDFYVSEETARLMDEAAAPRNTDRTYRSARGMFERWCAEMGRVARPCTTATYVEYIASLIAQEKYSPNTLKTHKSAIRSWQPEESKPGTKVVNGLIKEYAKVWGKRNRVKKAPPITDPMLRAMVATCDPRHPIGIRDRCALLLGRGALNRRIELADLLVSDVDVDDDFVTLDIRFDKTHQNGDGEPTHIPAEPDDLLMCPADATRAWFAMLHRLRVREGAFFRALTVAGTLQNRSTATERGDHVSGDAINDWVRGRAYAAGLPNWQEITAHGLRRGGAQAIADAGGDPTKQGRWRPGSTVVKKEYLDRAQSRAENPWLRVQAKRRGEE
ncbi:integrase [Streptomyces achromogenes]|uniref:integrase n=1 Tax=Streptomyces achromogenes TaxID=67255 RepID=UPI0036FA26E7